MKKYLYKEHPDSEPQGPLNVWEMQALRSSGSISDDMLIRRVSTRRRKSFMASPWQPAAKCWDCKPQPKADYLLPLLLLAANIILFFLSPSERLNMDFDAKDTLLPNGWSCIDQQEWWRFFTGLFMTGDPVLLAGNALLLLTVAPLLPPVLGRGGFLLFYFLCGIIGSFTAGGIILAYIPQIRDLPVPVFASPMGAATFSLIGASMVLPVWRAWKMPNAFWSMLLFLLLPLILKEMELISCMTGLIVGLGLMLLFKYFPVSKRSLLPWAFLIPAAAAASFAGTGIDTSLDDYSEGWAYMQGNGVTKDSRHAAACWHKAAVQGYAPAQTILGIYELRTRRNPERAVYWWKLAAASGDVEAQYRLGMAYRNGTGVSRNESQSRHWIERAAANRHRKAANALQQSETSDKQ
ncbi:tetratricopeptide repeat protein [Akkermansia glycaniphila]|uniref:Peptidase s54 rhomboid domain n=1 Tax=Akkermansia glycaniphila TaxID=1679444 RepID=A0A1H6MRS1_9BACT|nr:tetratricopeptide repeat protein [Akkermansia glycaniphila]SEI01350.1 peptidase s54 rhomboid domain [Akkermansia glycaniphila]